MEEKLRKCLEELEAVKFDAECELGYAEEETERCELGSDPYGYWRGEEDRLSALIDEIGYFVQDMRKEFRIG